MSYSQISSKKGKFVYTLGEKEINVLDKLCNKIISVFIFVSGCLDETVYTVYLPTVFSKKGINSVIESIENERKSFNKNSFIKKCKN